jgi:hypothetical protein
MTDTSPLLIPNQTAVPQDCLFNLKRSSVRARSYRASIPTSNKAIFSPSDAAVIFLPGGRKGTFLDPNQSYLKMTVQNNELVAGVNFFNFDTLGTSIINRIDTFHSGNSIDSLQQYNALMSYIVDAQLNQSEKFGLSNIYGTSASTNLNNARSGLAVYPGQRVTICVPLLGAFGLGADKLIPIGQLYDDIRIEISTSSIIEGVCWNAVPVNTINPFSIIDMQLELQIIELSDEGQHMVESITPFSNPVYMHANSWRHYVSTLPAGTGGAYSALVPARFASLKSIVVLPRRSTEINQATAYSTSSRMNPCISSYWFRSGAYMIPQRAVTLYSTSNTGGHGEAFMELQKSFHGVNRPDMSTGIPYYQYNVVDLTAADLTIGGMGVAGQIVPAVGSLTLNSHQNAFAIAQDFECFANKTDLLLSGMNTLSSQIFFECNVGWGTAGQTPTVAFTMDYYANYDLILCLNNGILSAKF